MADWHPDAIRQPLGSGVYIGGGAAKNVWHSTEGYNYPGPQIYHGTNPTFTFDFKKNKLYQHLPITRAAEALKHPAGTGQTNNDNCVQVELVGKAAESGDWSKTDYALIAELARWIEQNHGVARRGVNFKTQGRLAWPVWHEYSGHLGHRHVPSNEHTDPGEGFRIDLVLALPTRLGKWRLELAKRRRQLVASKHPGQRHYLIRRISALKKAIRKHR